MIEYPIKGLEIDKWIENEEEGERNFKYDLYAVCLHSGTAEYGHYKAYCKHFIS
jgi:ubiquitin C-terminal hydrolase